MNSYALLFHKNTIWLSIECILQVLVIQCMSGENGQADEFTFIGKLDYYFNAALEASQWLERWNYDG